MLTPVGVFAGGGLSDVLVDYDELFAFNWFLLVFALWLLNGIGLGLRAWHRRRVLRRAAADAQAGV